MAGRGATVHMERRSARTWRHVPPYIHARCLRWLWRKLPAGASQSRWSARPAMMRLEDAEAPNWWQGTWAWPNGFGEEEAFPSAQGTLAGERASAALLETA